MERPAPAARRGDDPAGDQPGRTGLREPRVRLFLALAPGWLNLGLWEGPGTEAEAEAACRRLIQTVASALPAGGVTVNVGNGLGTQDPLIAESVAPRRLVAVNIAEWQLAAGRDRLRRPGRLRSPATRPGCR